MYKTLHTYSIAEQIYTKCVHLS